jgi:hypothetical protein
MVLERFCRLPVETREDTRLIVGFISRSDLLAAHAPRLAAERDRGRRGRSIPKT